MEVKDTGNKPKHMETQDLCNTKLWFKLSLNWTSMTNARLKLEKSEVTLKYDLKIQLN